MRASQTKNLRKRRVRAKISGTADRPRLSVFRSNKHIHAQLIDDDSHLTVVSTSTITVKGGKTKTDKSKAVGLHLAAEAKKKGVQKAIFDRGSYRYHGRVKAIAEGAREGGLKF